MKSSFGTFVLRFAATAVLFAPAAAAQTPGVGQSVCRQVWDWGAGKYMQVCDSVYYPPQPTAPAPHRRQSLQSRTQQAARQPSDMMAMPRCEGRSHRPPGTNLRRVQVCAHRPTG
jgi:hypothetical protein